MKHINIYKKLIIIFLICIFLFPNTIVVAESREVNGISYTYVTPDDNQDGADVSEVDYTLTAYGGEGLGAGGVDESALIQNEKYGWQEYEENGIRYVVVAAATHEMLQSGSTLHDYHSFRFDHIHYFKYFQKIKFKFKDTNFDSNVYNAIILDSCGAAMFPQDPEWNRDPKVNIIDIFFGRNQSDGGLNTSPISGQHVDVSLDGTFSQTAAQTANAGSKKRWWSDWFSNALINCADAIQRGMDSMITNKPCRKQTYAVSDIERMSKKIEEKNKEPKDNPNKEEEENEEDDDDLDEEVIKALNIQKVSKENNEEEEKQEPSEEENIAKTIDLDKTIENSKGIVTTVYTASTEIPVIYADVYSMSKETFNLFDVNFYSKKEEKKGVKEVLSIWDIIRTYVVLCSRASIYLATAVLLTLLIYRGITFVLSIYRRTS